MAKFMSTILSAISGSVGGVTFSRSRSGSYMRNKSIPVSRNTSAQSKVKNIFGAVSSLWKSLTELKRTAWNQLASSQPYVDALGQSKHYSGFQLFKSLFTNAMAWAYIQGQPVAATFPVEARPAFPELLPDPNPVNAFKVSIDNEGPDSSWQDFSLKLRAMQASPGLILQVQITNPYPATRVLPVLESEFYGAPGIADDLESAAFFNFPLTEGYAPGSDVLSMVDAVQEVLPVDVAYIGKKISSRCRIISPLTGWAGSWLYQTDVVS